MGFLKNLLGKKDEAIATKEDFWKWFQTKEKAFFNVLKKGGNVEEEFFNRMSAKFSEMGEEYLFLAGMLDDHTAELVFTADGSIRQFVFIEELVSAAPAIPGWRFTAHKPALDIKDVAIRMQDHMFSEDNMSFYPTVNRDYPDEIEITVVHNDFTEENRNIISNGSFIFLDNYLGELRFATEIDNVMFDGKKSGQDLVPMSKLKDYLTWRGKEFIEKYEGIRHNTENDSYSALEAELESGLILLATINTDVLQWDSKASHPWIVRIEIKYSEPNVNNGMPDPETFALLDKIEDEVNAELKDFEGYIYIGRQTAEGVREIYFACKEFRKPSRVLATVVKNHSDRFDVKYEIYKDKYWRTFDRFRTE